MKRIIVVVVVLLIVGLVGWRVVQKRTRPQGRGPGGGGRNAAVAVVVAPVRREAVRDVRTFTGTVFPKAQFVVAPKVPGRLERLMVNIGQDVTNGALIATLDSAEYTRQVEQARAELDVAKATVADSQSTLDIATRELERAKELRKQQVASEAEMDQAEARYRAAQAKHAVALAQVKQREAALQADEVRLSYTRILAAWEDGGETRVVGERYVDEGAMLRATDPIVSILDVDTVIATLFAIERDYPYLAVGQSAVITTDAFPGKTFSGKIARKAPLLKESSRQARVEIEVANTDRRLAPGMFVRVEIQFAAHDDATVVPISAVARRDGQSGVFLADAAALKAQFVPVTLGVVNAEVAQVLAPEIEGQVITLGHHLLEDGSAIVIPRDEPESAPSPGTPTGAGEGRKAGGAR